MKQYSTKQNLTSREKMKANGKEMNLKKAMQYGKVKSEKWGKRKENQSSAGEKE